MIKRRGDRRKSAAFMWGGAAASQHYAFLISEDDFDQIFRRIRER